MQYFTFEWAMGDDEDRDPFELYDAFLNTLDQTSACFQFAKTVSLNDAYIDCVTYDQSTKTLRLLLLTGDLQIGYWRTELTYANALITGASILKKALSRRAPNGGEPYEIWYDEFSAIGERMRHSFLLAPLNFQRAKRGKVFHIDFDAFSYRQSPSDDRTLSTADDVSRW